MALMLFFDNSILHAQATLCSTYGGQTPSYVIGVGSPSNITHSSQLGSSLPYGSVINVVGNFIVNADFTLSGATVKVNTGAKIFVEANGSYSLVFFILDNTKVFACTGLWKGIEMDNFTGITTTNGTQIEDAENAIKSATGFVSLSINNTIFNRNLIGINLEAATNSWNPPFLTFFINNVFSCDSPLNGTTNGKTEVGFRMKNINYPLVFNYGNSNNIFSGIKNGFYLEASSGMELINYRFQSIDYNCVEFKNAEHLYVKNSIFTDIKRKGIFSQNSRSLGVEDSQFSGSSFSDNPDPLKNRYMIQVRMYLYRSIKANPNAFNGNRAYNSFLQRNNGRNKDKFTDLEKAIDESGKIKEQTKAKIADFKNKIKNLETEAKRYNRNNRPSIDAQKAWYKQRLDLDEAINAQYEAHKSEKKIKHQAAKRILDNAAPVTANERLIKDVYTIYLDAQINNDGKFTAEQTARLKAIAQTCVTEGGMIVYVARGLLSENDLHEIQEYIGICEPRFSYESASRDAIVNPNNITQQNKSIATIIYPNPAAESFTINVQDNLSATAHITDIMGKILKTYNLQAGANTIRHNLPKGMYIINVKMSDGKTLTDKLFISY